MSLYAWLILFFFFFLKHKCFKKEDPVLQLMSLGWSVPFEPWLLRAGRHSCQSVSIGRMGPGSWSLLGICAHSLWGLLAQLPAAGRLTGFLCPVRWGRGSLRAPDSRQTDRVLVSHQVRAGSMGMEILPVRKTSMHFGILSWTTQIARVSTFSWQMG